MKIRMLFFFISRSILKSHPGQKIYAYLWHMLIVGEKTKEN